MLTFHSLIFQSFFYIMGELSFVDKPLDHPIKYKSIVDVFNENVCEFPEKEIFIQLFPDGSRRPITFRDLKLRATRTASFLLDQGIQAGDRVGITGPNSIEWIIGELAILMTGAVSIHLPIIQGTFKKTLDDIKISGCKSVLLDPENDRTFIEDIEDYVSFNPPTDKNRSSSPFFVLLRKIEKSNLPDVESLGKEYPATDDLPRVFPESSAIVFTTSGSTGNPKMAEFTHLALVNTKSAYMLTRVAEERGGSYFSDWPFSWIGGNIIYALIQVDTRVFRDGRISAQRGDIMELWNIIMEEQCTSGLLLPFTIYDILQNKEKIVKTGYRMKSVLTGGQIIKHKETGIIGDICESMYMVYGSTEVGLVTYCRLDSNMEVGHLGSIFPGVQIKVCGEDMNPLVRGEMGRFFIKTPWMLQGYLNATEDHKKAIVDGWMNMGDVGILKSDGRLLLKGKLNSIIKRGTLIVVSGEVEECITSIAGVKDAVVIAIPDERVYEEVCACVVLDKNAPITMENVRQRCREILGDNIIGQAPTFYLEFDSLSILPTGKPDKKKMTEAAMAKLNSNN
ncbi:putative acyl--CoA ligase YdaB [Argopecten irradians]|uniref:putative acyl--CoA ligase YdaB n=1 Tax=Argopecten irradians TaxID=31199 RepID=UPI00371A5D12